MSDKGHAIWQRRLHVLSSCLMTPLLFSLSKTSPPALPPTSHPLPHHLSLLLHLLSAPSPLPLPKKKKKPSFSSLSAPPLHLLLFHASSPSVRLVSQDALFQAAPLGPSSMGGAWVGRDSTDWTLPLRTGALAGHPPSASDGRGR